MNTEVVRVLLVGNSDEDSNVVEATLEVTPGKTFTLERARSSTAALLMMEHDPPDIILLSLSLDDCQGEEVVNQFMSWIDRIPILICSFHDSAGGIRLRSIGIQHHIQPDDRALVADMLSAAVDRHRLSEQIGDIDRSIRAADRALRETEGPPSQRFAAAIIAFDKKDE